MAQARSGLNFVVVATVASLVLGTTGCADRLEPPVPERHPQIESMTEWAQTRAKPYGIPQRQLEAYAYAAHKVGKDSGCAIGWPTIAALGSVLSNHGRARGATVAPDGVTTVKLRGLTAAAGGKKQVTDTDAGEIDGDSKRDVPVGPMQIMPSRWKESGTAVEPGAMANPDSIDDAALTTALMLCNSGDVSSPDGWAEAIAKINPSKKFLKTVHAKAKEYSR